MNAPLAHPLVADDWSTEYEFSEMEIRLSGITLDGGFYGTATLALNNPDDRDFYVKSIAVKGHTKEPFWRSYGYRDSRRMETVLLLDPADLRANPDPDKSWLLAQLRTAIEADEGAAEWFRQQLGDE